MPGALFEKSIVSEQSSPYIFSFQSAHAPEPEDIQTVQDGILFDDDKRLPPTELNRSVGAQQIEPDMPKPTNPTHPEAAVTSELAEPSPPSCSSDVHTSNAAGQPTPPEDDMMDIILFQGTSNKRDIRDDGTVTGLSESALIHIRLNLLSTQIVPVEKRRYEEVDYSKSLRKELYEKEELVGRLRSRLRQQGTVS
jgi:hypothetical protein